MNRKFVLLLLVLPFFTLPVFGQGKLNPSVESRIDRLLAQMSLEEKVGQMAQVSIESLGWSEGGTFHFSDKLKDAVVNYKIGSILNSPGPLQSPKDWNRIVGEIQTAASQTRLKIPVIYGLDNIHGVSYSAGSTLFPQQIGQAAT